MLIVFYSSGNQRLQQDMRKQPQIPQNLRPDEIFILSVDNVEESKSDSAKSVVHQQEVEPTNRIASHIKKSVHDL